MNSKHAAPAPLPAGKWWAASMTIWGAAVTALSTVMPVIAPALGLDISPQLVRQAGDDAVAVVQAIGGLAGLALTVYGRLRATTHLTRRELRVRM